MTINPGGWGVQGMLEEQVLGTRFNPSGTAGRAGSWAAVSCYPTRDRWQGRVSALTGTDFLLVPSQNKYKLQCRCQVPECKWMQNRALEMFLLTSTYHGSAAMFSCWWNSICGFRNQVRYTKWLSALRGTWWGKGNLVWLAKAGRNGGRRSEHEKCRLPLHRTRAQQYPEPGTPMQEQEIILGARRALNL